MSAFGTLHHVEVPVTDLERTIPGWEWLLGELGYKPFQRWAGGRSWRLGATYIVVARAVDRPHARARLSETRGAEKERFGADSGLERCGVGRRCAATPIRGRCPTSRRHEPHQRCRWVVDVDPPRR